MIQQNRKQYLGIKLDKNLKDNQSMQYSEKTFGSQNAIKQLYRQYSGTFKNNFSEKNKTMTQSSNIPFDNMYNAFNSTGNMKSIPLDRFKHSQAKSIIEKLMQTREIPTSSKDDQIILMNELQNVHRQDLKQAITLGDTECKIFYQVVNLLSQIQQIREKRQVENEQLTRIRIQLKSQGIDLPQLQEKQTQSTSQTLRRFTSVQLQTLYQQNDHLSIEIQKITKQLTNSNQHQREETLLEEVVKENSQLRKQLSSIKLDILNAGQGDQNDLHQLNYKVEELRKHIFLLEQKRISKLTDKDEQLRILKSQNDKLRYKTIQILKNITHPHNRKRQDLIHSLMLQENNKARHAQEINQLKNRYQTLMLQNSRLKKSAGNYYDQPLQVQSKVSPFHNTYGEYQSAYRGDKENYLFNYQPQRTYKPYTISQDFLKNDSKYSYQRS